MAFRSAMLRFNWKATQHNIFRKAGNESSRLSLLYLKNCMSIATEMTRSAHATT